MDDDLLPIFYALTAELPKGLSEVMKHLWIATRALSLAGVALDQASLDPNVVGVELDEMRELRSAIHATRVRVGKLIQSNT